MYDIEMQKVSPEFVKCWQVAGAHLQSQVQSGQLNWLRAYISPPFLEHLSFRLGNQLFFIRICEDGVEGLDVPGSAKGLLTIADGCKGHACLMPMKKDIIRGTWVPERPGWGLIDARTHGLINPASLVTNEKIEMTPWELHDFAVQVVRDQLKKEGRELISWQGDPNVDPAIWFVGDSKSPKWVVVRAVRYPEKEAKRPDNWENIAKSCEKLSKIGCFASVAFASVNESFDSNGRPPIPLWRGHGVHVSYQGLSV